MFSRARPPRGRRIGAVTNSGGEGAYLADQAGRPGFRWSSSRRACALASGRVPELRPDRQPGGLLGHRRRRARLPAAPSRCCARRRAYDVLIAQLDLSRASRRHGSWCRRSPRPGGRGRRQRTSSRAVTAVHATDPPPSMAALARRRDVAAAARHARGPARASPARAIAAARLPPAGGRAGRRTASGGRARRACRARLVRAARALRRRAFPRAARAAHRPMRPRRRSQRSAAPSSSSSTAPAHKQAGRTASHWALERRARARGRGAHGRSGARRAPGARGARGVLRHDPRPRLRARAGRSDSAAARSRRSAWPQWRLAPLDLTDARALVARGAGSAHLASAAARGAAAGTLVALSRLARETVRRSTRSTSIR